MVSSCCWSLGRIFILIMNDRSIFILSCINRWCCDINVFFMAKQKNGNTKLWVKSLDFV